MRRRFALPPELVGGCIAVASCLYCATPPPVIVQPAPMNAACLTTPPPGRLTIKAEITDGGVFVPTEQAALMDRQLVRTREWMTDAWLRCGVLSSADAGTP